MIESTSCLAPAEDEIQPRSVFALQRVAVKGARHAVDNSRKRVKNVVRDSSDVSQSDSSQTSGSSYPARRARSFQELASSLSMKRSDTGSNFNVSPTLPKIPCDVDQMTERDRTVSDFNIGIGPFTSLDAVEPILQMPSRLPEGRLIRPFHLFFGLVDFLEKFFANVDWGWT